MEKKLKAESKDQFTKGLKGQASPLVKMFSNRAKKFDGESKKRVFF
jgi:hypothetical protein